MKNINTILCLFLLFCWNTLDAQNVYIPDANFKTALLNNAQINTNGDTAIQVSEAQAFTGGIYVGYSSISDLTGIEAFTAITELNCNDNQLTSLDISANTNLAALNCRNNQLLSLDISNNLDLFMVWCDSNNLTNLNTSSTNSKLVELSCNDNNITSLNLSNHTAIARIYCGFNNIINLDITGDTSLEYLECSYNQLTSLDISTNLILEQLYCDSNFMTNLDGSANVNLRELWCSSNNLTNLIVPPNLNRLFCLFNNLTSLDLSMRTVLHWVDCSYNQLTSLNISGCYIPLLQCNNNQLSNFSIPPNTHLQYLDCSYNQLINLDISSDSILGYLDCSNNQLTSLTVFSNNNLYTLNCNNNPSLTCLSLLPPNLVQLFTNVSCLPNIPIGLSTTIPLCHSLPINPCFQYPSVTGHAYIDMDNNGSQDSSDFNAPYRVISGSLFATATNSFGNYNLIVDTNTTQNIAIQNINNNYFSISPASISITTTNASAQHFPNSNFRLIPIGIQPDAEAHFVGGQYRSGFNTTIAFTCKNVGNTVIDPAITVSIDPSLVVVSSSTIPDGGGAVSHNMTFSSTGLAPLEQITIYVEVFTPVNLLFGNPIVNTMSIAITNEVTPDNNAFTENTIVIASCDPNDKTADIDYITPTEIAAGKEINYTIRFQNTGNLAADFVIVTDTLDNDLDVNTLELVSTSHYLSKMTVETDITHPNQPNVVKWYFYNINLPDSTSDEAGSHGFIRFSIRSKSNVLLGSLIENNAGIVFDFNAPVITNTWTIPVTLGSNIATVESIENYKIYPNPVQNTLFVQALNNDEYSISLLSMNGQLIESFQNNKGTTTLDMRNLQNGLYLLQIVNKQGVFTQKVLVGF